MAILPESSQITSVTTTPSMIASTELQIGRKRLSKIIRMTRENMFTPERYYIYFTNSFENKNEKWHKTAKLLHIRQTDRQKNY